MNLRIGALTMHRNGDTGIVVEIGSGKWPVTVNLNYKQINLTRDGFVHEKPDPGVKQQISIHDIIKIYGFIE